MPDLVIVAIPEENDYVNRISSQEVAHMTILFLGDMDKISDLTSIIGFVKHAADMSLSKFGMEVDHRGKLGLDEADVLFFAKSKWSGYGDVNTFRSNLLKNDSIRTAYDSAEQHPEWVPHLTLGYPDSPAKPDERDYPGIQYVSFDRIAVWSEEFDGIEIPLKSYNWAVDMAMSVDDVVTELVLSHHGIKGMKWGIRNSSRQTANNLRGVKSQTVRSVEVRRAQARSPEVTVRDKGKKLKTVGGKGLPAHSDAIRVREIGQKGKGSGLKTLSDKELKDYANRLQLEQNVHRLNHNEKNAGARFVSGLLKTQGSRAAKSAAETAGTIAGKGAINAATRRSAKIAATVAFA